MALQLELEEEQEEEEEISNNFERRADVEDQDQEEPVLKDGIAALEQYFDRQFHSSIDDIARQLPAVDWSLGPPRDVEVPLTQNK